MCFQPCVEVREGEPGASDLYREAKRGESPPAGAAAPHPGVGQGEPKPQQEGRRVEYVKAPSTVWL